MEKKTYLFEKYLAADGRDLGPLGGQVFLDAQLLLGVFEVPCAFNRHLNY